MGKDAPHPKYLVCNADEMEPGTFKDRALMEYDPHQLIEGMIIAALAIEADIGYIFLRGEYTKCAERLSLRHLGGAPSKITWAKISAAPITRSTFIFMSAPAVTFAAKKPLC